MPYIYPNAASLQNKTKVGTTDCVALVRFDNRSILPGTAIATFVKGRYPSMRHGNYAAFFLRQGPKGDGFWIIDQWKDAPGRGKKPLISARYIKALHVPQNADGSWPRASENADAYSIIEAR